MTRFVPLQKDGDQMLAVDYRTLLRPDLVHYDLSQRPLKLLVLSSLYMGESAELSTLRSRVALR
jgi:hypothetical protein